MEELIEKLAAVDVVKMINDSEREQIYQDLVDKSVTVDEFIAYNKKFGLDNPDKPMTYEDIKRASVPEEQEIQYFVFTYFAIFFSNNETL